MIKHLEQLTDIPLNAPVKVAFFDIDGTLLDKEGRYSADLRSQIMRIRGRGIKTAIASGRPLAAAQFLIDELGISDPGVFCTGAYVYSPIDGQLLLQAPLPQGDALALLQCLRQRNIYYELYSDKQFYYETDFAPYIRRVHGQHLRCQAVKADLRQVILSEPILKFIVGVDQSEDQQSLEQLEGEFPGLHFAYASLPGYPHWRFANVIDRGACKRRAFELLLEHYQVAPENVASFGDSHSDEIFLGLAGTGVAMGNAAAEAKDAARFITKNAWDDGVAYALSRLIK